jgi:DNA-binding PadR family transcriptional regulator
LEAATVARNDRKDAPRAALSDLAFHVLLALRDGAGHGYEIGRKVEELSEGRLDPTTGALYQALRRLVEDELIAHAEAPEGVDPRRKYVTLTKAGRRAVAEEAERLERLVRVAKGEVPLPGQV